MNEYELYHHGILGMKWGVRRYQNVDGSLTAAGRRRYGTKENYKNYQKNKEARREYNKSFNKAYNKQHQAYSLSKKKREENTRRWEDVSDKADKYIDAHRKYRRSNTGAKLNKKLARSKESDAKFLSERSEYRSARNSRYDKRIEKQKAKLDKQIAKLNRIKNKKSKFSHDYDERTRVMKAGQDRYNSVIRNYRDARLKAFDDATFSKSPEYKNAVKEYVMQTFNDAYYLYTYGSGASRLTKNDYAHKIARDSKK